MIRTPPNATIAQYRANVFDQPFTMFDFAPVGGVIAILGVIYRVLFGRRLVPRHRRGQGNAEDIFQIQDYMTEVRLGADTSLVGRSNAALPKLDDLDVLVTALIRGAKGDLRPVGEPASRPMIY